MDKFAIPKRNIVYILAGLALIILGYILLSGGGAENQQVFNYDLFNFRRMYVAPLLIIAGFVIEIFAILRIKPLKKNK
ncbi:MAG: DUF3098 domain-containing protein [Bacteroidales bacterium]|nr:DUF3098 domain-containing protein [Bacteroidales bacterium]